LSVYEFRNAKGETLMQFDGGRRTVSGWRPSYMPPLMGQGMCSGLRDAANLAWKIALIIKAGIDPALLDTYQIERDPHVRHIIERAIHMGRVICTLDAEVARHRDAEMIASRGANQAGAFPGLPALKAGFLAATRLAGELFPQPMARLQTEVKDASMTCSVMSFWLISRNRLDCMPISHVKALRLGYDLFDDGTIDQWLDQANAEAVIVRPDRYVFGTGSAGVLANILGSALAPKRKLSTDQVSVRDD
jgi:3-(3-hydroxy-phenyl)propionate hydroxylase